jgi:hypothetical protein
MGRGDVRMGEKRVQRKIKKKIIQIVEWITKRVIKVYVVVLVSSFIFILFTGVYNVFIEKFLGVIKDENNIIFNFLLFGLTTISLSFYCYDKFKNSFYLICTKALFFSIILLFLSYLISIATKINDLMYPFFLIGGLTFSIFLILFSFTFIIQEKKGDDK